MSGDNKNEIEQLENSLQRIQEEYLSICTELNEYTAEAKKIEDRLQSYALRAGELFSFGTDAEQQMREGAMSPQEIMQIPTEELSRKGLENKFRFVKSKEDDLNKESLTKQDLIAKFTLLLNEAKNGQEQSSHSTFADKVRAECIADTNKFYSEVLLPAVPTHLKPDELYPVARKIIAASSVLPAEKNRYRILCAWALVVAARDRASREYIKAGKPKNTNKVTDAQEKYNLHKEFYEGARECFDNMVDKLGLEWQNLKPLYREDPELAAEYFAKKGYREFTPEGLKNVITKKFEDKAKKTLERLEGFTLLPEEMQKMLIHDQVILYELEFALSVASADEKAVLLKNIKKCIEKLAENIKNALEGRKTPEEIAVERERINVELAAEISKLDETIKLKEKVTDGLSATDRVPVIVGASAFLLGSGLIMSGAYAVGAAATTRAVKAKLDTSADKVKMEELKEMQEDVKSLTPAEYKLWYAAKKKWEELDVVDPELDFKTLQEHVDDKVDMVKSAVQQKKDELEKKISDGVSKATLFIKRAISGLAIAILIAAAITIAIPATWPIVALVCFIGIGAVGYVARQKYNNPGKPAPTLMGPINVINNVKSSFGNLAKIVVSIVRKKDNAANPGKEDKVSSEAAKNPNIVVEPGNVQTMFLIPPESMQALQTNSPLLGESLAKKLVDHFSGRLNELIQLHAEARKADDRKKLDVVGADLGRLEEDWSKIIKSAATPEQFCSAVGVYLQEAFNHEKEVMKQQARPVTFSGGARGINDTSIADLAPSRIAQEQRHLEELLELKKTNLQVIRSLKR